MTGNIGKDGLSRQKRADDVKITVPFRILEDNPSRLFIRALENSSFIRYFNPENHPDGYWKSLYDRQAPVILSEIKQLNLVQSEQHFVSGTLDERLSLVDFLVNRIQNWRERLKSTVSSNYKLLLAVDLENQINVNLRNPLCFLQMMPLVATLSSLLEVNWGKADSGYCDLKIQDKELVYLFFYKILESLRVLQNNAGAYTDDMENAGEIDPSMALILVFVDNYGNIATQFNKRWEELPLFYIEKILHVHPRGYVPDRTWLVLTPGEQTTNLLIPSDTAFIAGKQADDTPVIYRNKKDCFISRMQLRSVLAYTQKQFLYRKDLSSYIQPDDSGKIESESLFTRGDSKADLVSMGLLFESPLFFLSSGQRKIRITLKLKKKEEKKKVLDITKKNVFFDSFLPDISTQEGWTAITDYQYVYEKKTEVLELTFNLPPAFPATAACNDVYGEVTNMPVLRLLMNPEADYYPYSWAIYYLILNMKIRVEVSEMQAIELAGVAGPMSVTQPFYPFGPQPDKGAWMTWKSEEIAQKPLKSVDFTCNWLDIPLSENGFYDVYKTNTPPLDNSSFKVTPSYSSGSRWITGESATTELFSYVSPRGRVKISSTFSWNLPACILTDGLFRLELAGPDIGFGQAVYWQMFNEIMIRNISKKKKTVPPAPPVTPLMDQVRIAYVAEEEILFQPTSKKPSTLLYYIHPLMEDCLRQIETDEPALVFEGLDNKQNLLFGITRAVGESRLRLFIRIKSRRQALNAGEELQIRWLIKRNRWDWYKLSPEALLSDTTENLLQTGLVELQLPEPVSEEWLDEEKIFWLCAAIKNINPVSPVVSGFFMNALEVTLDTSQKGFDEKQLPAPLPIGTITEAEKDITGVEAILQVTPAIGGCREETREEMRVRIVNRITHRDRAVLRRDYEELILSNFPDAGKAYCYGTQKLEKGKSLVELTVVPNTYSRKTYPLCDGILLRNIETFLRQRCSLFIEPRVDNPFYEEITVRCWIDLVNWMDIPLGVVEQEIVKRIENCIAPWLENSKSPVFNHAFSLDDMRNSIGNSKYIVTVQKLVVLQRTRNGELWYLKDYTDIASTNTEQYVCPSYPGNILYPAKKHLIRTTDMDNWEDRAGIGELEINNTFIIR